MATPTRAGVPETRPLARTRAGPVRGRPTLRRIVHQAVVLGVLYGVYALGRAWAGRFVDAADEHARAVWALEQALGLPSEEQLQRAVLGLDALIRAANLYYEYVHWLMTVAVVLFLLLRRPHVYPWFRAVLVLTTGLALIGHFAYPETPPRMRPDFVDTAVRYGESAYPSSYQDAGLVNQYAAMPSMHVAWAVLFAATLILCLRSRWRWLIALYPVTTTLVVVITANHYWLDGVVGVGLLAVAAAVFHRRLPAPDP